MFRLLIITSLLFWGLPCSLASSPESTFHIILDPGHGGHDGGAKRGHTKESDIVLIITRRLKALLDQDSRFKATMTRNSDQFLKLSQRAQIANQAQADLYLSIHANASVDSRAKGLEVYFQNQLPPDEEAMYMANLEEQSETQGNLPTQKLNLDKYGIQTEKMPADARLIIEDLLRADRIKKSSQFSKSIYRNWRGTRKSKQYSIRQAPFYVVSNVNMPSALVEVGFVSNSKDRKYLKTRTYQNKIAESLFTSIVKYQESIDK